MRLYLPNPTEVDKKEAFEHVKELTNKNKNWRLDYFKFYPAMNNQTGISKINNFVYRHIFDADIYRSIVTFFKSTNL